MLRLAAPWVIAGAGEIFAEGAVLIGEDGRIVQTGPDAAVPSPPGAGVERFPGAAIIPGLVNAHTHLELTGFDQRISEAEFPAWIRHLIELKAARTASDFRDAARQGARDCLAAGVTTVADTGDSGAVLPAMIETGLGGIAYLRCSGLSRTTRNAISLLFGPGSPTCALPQPTARSSGCRPTRPIP